MTQQATNSSAKKTESACLSESPLLACSVVCFFVLQTTFLFAMHTTIPMVRNTTQVATHRKICCALYTDILSTQPGLCKLGELIFGGICVGLMVTYGTPVWLTLGFAYPLFLVNSSAALLFTCVTLFSYLVSEHTFRAIRTTILEIVQNAVSAVLYAVGSAFLIMHTTFFLWPLYIIIPYFQAYPALMTAGVFGCLCGLVHALDAYFAYRTFKSIR